MGQFLASLWPRLEKKLTTTQSNFDFVWWFVGYSGLPYQMEENGILLIEPCAEESPSSAAIEAVEQTAADIGVANGNAG